MKVQQRINQDLENAQQSFQDRLEFLGFGVDAIQHQTVDQLRVSLEQINRYIEHPESQRVLEVKQDSQFGLYVTSSVGVAISFNSIFLPLLLNRKKLILEQLEAAQVDERVNVLYHAVEQISDSSSRSHLLSEIDELQAVCRVWREELNQLARDQEQLREQREKYRLSWLEERSKIWRSMLDRESAATVIGVILLVVIALGQVALLIFKIQPSETLNNSFLLILGYFFGHSLRSNAKDCGLNKNGDDARLNILRLMG